MADGAIPRHEFIHSYSTITYNVVEVANVGKFTTVPGVTGVAPVSA